MAATANDNFIEVDISTGGNGDIWMRLVGFYAAAALLPQHKFKLLIPLVFKAIAEFTFGDRLILVTQTDTIFKYTYTVYGLRDLLKPIFKGQRFIAPYQRAVVHDKKKTSAKDAINNMLFDLADWLGLVVIPSSKWIECYQSYMEIIGLKQLKGMGYEAFTTQIKVDYELIFKKLNLNIPISSELNIPSDLKESTVVFPTGTSRQFVPVWWAVQNLPDAYYAFFFKDPEAGLFAKAGLKIVLFYKEPGDIIKLSHAAKRTISTDSFPGHLLQYSSPTTTILITEVLKSRIISPAFTGDVVDAEVACHPCLHMNRKIHPTCAAGYTECLNWKNDTYTQNILRSDNFSHQE